MSNFGNPAQGWYPDPQNPGTERWWDGQAWGEQTQTAGAQQAPPANAVFTPPLTPTPGQQDGPAVSDSRLTDSPPPPTGPAAGPGSGPQPSTRAGCLGMPIALGVVIVAFAAVLGSCTAGAVFFARSSGEVESDFSAIEAESPEEPPLQEITPNDLVTPPEQDGLVDVISCERIETDAIVLEVVNTSSMTASYALTVAYFSDEGQRLADDQIFLENVLSGERSIEEHFTLFSEGTFCEALEAVRMSEQHDQEAQGDIGECELGTPAESTGFFKPSVTVTNSTSVDNNYLVMVALVDSEGVRRTTGIAVIDVVPPEESAPGDAVTLLPFAEGFSCDVREVIRTPS